MIIKECAFLSKEDLFGNPSQGTCNLFPKEEIRLTRFINCEAIPISKCPYKMYKEGLITKDKLNEKIINYILEKRDESKKIKKITQ